MIAVTEGWTGMLAGAMVYDSLVIVPARRAVPIDDQLEGWREYFSRAKSFFQAVGMALLGPMGYCLYQSGFAPLWAAAIAPVLLVGPYTALFIKPHNDMLESKRGDELSPAALSAAMSKWARRHHVRTAMFLFSYACIFAQTHLVL